MRDDLLDLHGVALRIGDPVRDLRADADLALLDLLGVQLQRRLQRDLEAEPLAEDRALLIGELAQVGHDLRHPAGLLLDLLDGGRMGRPVAQFLAQDREEAGDRGERVVQLVGHGGPERAERGQAARAQDLVLRRFQLGGALVDALLELRVPGADLAVALLDLERHVVEGGGELPDLVARVDVGSGVVAPFGQRPGRLGQLADRLAQAP